LALSVTRQEAAIVELSVSTERQGDMARIVVSGDVDMLSGRQLAAEIDNAISGSPSAAVVDLSAAGFLDSSGVAVLINGRRQAEEAGVRFRVVGASGIVLQVLTLTGVWEFLNGEAGQ
jgi:anti-sigma B factor antagonist